MIINDNYKNQLKELHSNPKTFNNGTKQYKVVKDFIKSHKIDSLLDFGCGKGGLIQCIKELHPEINRVVGYDPGYEEFEKLPLEKFDCVISTDAMEHIEPEFLNDSLTTIDDLFSRYCFLRIACYKAKKTLPDGRNAHLIIESPAWWIDKVKEFISGNIIHTEIRDFYGTPKKGPPIVGEEVIIIIEKNGKS
jgi:SAM-dependent methyltransferase